jgi:ATP-dependent Clp protease ATP-binding subunit ClpA
MKEHIVGQDHVITLLGNELQQTQSSSSKNANIFGAYLFVGPHHVGKRTCAIAFAEQLYKQTHMLYFAESSSPQSTSLVNIRLQRHQDQQYTALKDVIREYPYAIIVFENIEQASSLILNALEEIFCTSYLNDADGNRYYFRNAIFILSTTSGSKSLQKLSKTFSETRSKNIDLIQLIMNDKTKKKIHLLRFLFLHTNW